MREKIERFLQLYSELKDKAYLIAELKARQYHYDRYHLDSSNKYLYIEFNEDCEFVINYSNDDKEGWNTTVLVSLDELKEDLNVLEQIYIKDRDERREQYKIEKAEKEVKEMLELHVKELKRYLELKEKFKDLKI